jgi:hypothetical protein
MAFTYTAGSTANLDRVRLEIGDTDEDRSLFTDEEINDLIVQEGAVYSSAARACEILAVRFARDFNFTADGASFQKASVAQMYATLAKRLRARGRGTTVVQTRRKDAYSDDINSDTAATGGTVDFDRGRFDL